MAYNLHYFFTWIADKDTRQPLLPADTYECWIRELDYVGATEELETQDSPVTIDYQNTNSDKLQPLRGSEATANLIATENFQLEALFTENERKYVKQIRRYGQITVNWSNNTIGSDLILPSLEIRVNGVIKVNSFAEESGQFKINRGDSIDAVATMYVAFPTVYSGLQLDFSRLPTLRTETAPGNVFYDDIIPEDNIRIAAYSTYSASEYTAIRSEVFYNAQTGWPITYTRSYQSAVSQAAAQAIADADTDFPFAGQVFANGAAIYPAIWRGFIIPDGARQAFTFPPIPISINAVEGQGLLKNLSFVDEDGFPFIGLYNFIEIINMCLRRVGVPDLILNTCVNIYEISMTQGDEYDPMELTYVNAERYLKDDGFTPMNCEEVMLSILEEWTSCLIMSEGEMWIYRPTEAAESANLTFRRYLDAVHMQDYYTVTKDVSELLGGDSEGEVLAPLFHINADQETMIERPYRNASYSYRWGFNASEMANPNFLGWDGTNFPDWTRTEVTTILSEDPDGGAKIGWDTVNVGGIEITTGIPGTEGSAFRMVISYQNVNARGPQVRLHLTDGVDDYYLLPDGSWQTPPYIISPAVAVDLAGVIDIETLPLPISGDLFLATLGPISDATPLPDPSTVFMIYRKADLYGVAVDTAIGEIHTATQTEDFTTIPETKQAFNADSPIDQYVGDMYLDSGGVDLTTLWNRRGIAESALAMPYAESKPFLRIAAEETVRLYGSPFVRFEGSIFGYFNPLSRFNINLLTGKFMPLAIRYDLQTNIHRATLGRVDNTEIEMNYTLLGDYGDTQKVTIR